ncbi:HAD-IIIA family hydrolase [Candidatus Woesearchaeota archaeon]|nr:HAD-IIIA family hydrolase [Candidatus Woesearchaeota archaeon]
MSIKISKEVEKALTSKKILSYPQAIKKIEELKKQGKKVGLCQGGFDLLHPGQMKHFESAKKLCDVLIVSVNTDRFVASRKGSGRPVYPDNIRAYSVACLESVDFVIISDYQTAVDVIHKLKPSCYIKGSDYISKTTPGITAEREAIASVNGEMKYTDDPNLSTTEIIRYIKEELDRKNLLLVIDRDGTLILDKEFIGKNSCWKDEISINKPVIDFIIYLQTKFDTTKVVVSNQNGVARKMFTCKRVEEINDCVDAVLKKCNVKIDNWQYCPDADAAFVKKKKGQIDFDPKYVKEKTKRKPSPEMVFDALKALGKKLDEFTGIIVLGDSEDDRGLAANLNARFIDVRDKSYEDLKKDF